MILAYSLLWLSSATCLGVEESSPGARSEKDPRSKPKKVYTNEDLIRLQETRPINQAPQPSRDSRGTRTSSKPAGVDGYRDIHGRDRRYWQQKIRPLRRQAESLDAQIASLEAQKSRMSAASGVKISRSGRLQANSSDTRAQLTKRIEALHIKRNETLKSIQEIEEDARKAQALPEWLR